MQLCSDPAIVECFHRSHREIRTLDRIATVAGKQDVEPIVAPFHFSTIHASVKRSESIEIDAIGDYPHLGSVYVHRQRVFQILGFHDNSGRLACGVSRS